MTKGKDFYMLVGFPGSGKEAYTVPDQADSDSSDANIRRNYRKDFLSTHGCEYARKVCIVFIRRPDCCSPSDKNSINSFLRTFDLPDRFEGWDEVLFLAGKEAYAFDLAAADLIDQENPHHSRTVGGHLRAAAAYAAEHGFGPVIEEAALYHDCGKPETKDFVDRKGNYTPGHAHFNGHECCSAYLYLCEKLCGRAEGPIPDDEASAFSDQLYAAHLIAWHMHPLREWKDDPSSQEKDRRAMGEAMYRDLMKVHEADTGAR